MTPIRISIAEDNEPMRRGLADLISGVDEFELIGSFACARDIFENIKDDTDVLILDFELPDFSALEILRRLKTNERLSRVRVLIFTAFEDESRLIHAMEAGANGFLLKDTSRELLVAEIRSVFHGGAPITPRMARALCGRFVQVDSPLTAQERRVLNILGMGLSYSEAGRKLNISISTVKNHVESIYRKLEVRSKSGAVEKGRKLGIL